MNSLQANIDQTVSKQEMSSDEGHENKSIQNRFSLSDTNALGGKDVVRLVGFDSNQWSIHLGEVEEIPLPKKISNFLLEKCPINPPSIRSDTHFLCLIPKEINGHPYTLNLLDELLKEKNDQFPFNFKLFLNSTRKAIGNQSVEDSYYILITKNVLPMTIGQSFSKQKEQIPSGYDTPTALEMATAVVAYFFKTGGNLIGMNQEFEHFYTRCKDEIEENLHAVLGAADQNGFKLYHHTTFEMLGMNGCIRFIEK